MDEFGLIAKYLAPLSANVKGALNLTDDAALLPQGLAVTKDAIIEGVHFFPSTEPGLIASKLLRTNLSDMAAMGAIPRYYLIAAMLNDKVDESWVRAFTESLAKEQALFGISLIGGDTVKHSGLLSFSLTMIGEVEEGKALKRSTAKVGDAIYVSGTIGDAALGLLALKNQLAITDSAFLIDRYHLPQPRITLGQQLLGYANAAMDISDGLLADLSHILKASNLGADIQLSDIPLSPAARKVLAQRPELIETIVTGGDDYELLFTASQELAFKSHAPVTRIGVITESKDLKILDEKGQERHFLKKGYTHL